MKDKVCERCGKVFEAPTNSDEIVDLRKKGDCSLIISGIDVEVHKDFIFGFCLDCRKGNSIDLISEVVSLDENEKPVVNWKKYKRNHYINQVLNRLGILSGDAEGNWIVMSQKHGCQNPMFNRSVNLYFTSPDDASEFVDAKKLRRCHVMRVDQVFAA